MTARPGAHQPASDEPAEPAFFLRWTFATTLAFVPAALAVPLLLQLQRMFPDSNQALTWTALGIIEGFALGLAQSFVLRRLRIDFEPQRWIAATTVASALVWLVGSFLSVEEGTMAEELPLVLMLFWAGHGVLIGLAQWWVSRRTLAEFAGWAAVCGLAWVAGERLTYSCLVSAGHGADAFIMFIPRVSMGFGIAAITAVGMIYLLGDRLQETKDRQ